MITRPLVVLHLPDYPEYDGGGVLVQGGARLLHDGHRVGGDCGQPCTAPNAPPIRTVVAGVH
jgi:hypothetical protein